MLILVMLGLVAIPLVWSAISPRSLWSVVARPQFRNADAVEPSASSFMLWRVVAIVALVVLVGVVWALLTQLSAG